MISAIIFIGILLAEMAIFSAPVRISAIKRRAIASRAWRWGAIVLLGSLPSLFHLVGFLWVEPQIELIFANIYYTENADVYGEDRDALVTELRWHNFVFWDDDRCFTDNESVCAAADDWRIQQAEQQAYNQQYERTSLSDIIAALFAFAIVLFPTWITGYAVYHMTRDNRKQKYKA